MSPMFRMILRASVLLLSTEAFAEPMGEVTSNMGMVGGRQRYFVEYIPKTLKANAPLLFVLHPSGGDGASMRDYSNYEFDELADANGFLVVYPDGFENTWNDCRGGSPFSSKALKIDDVGFIRRLIEHEVETRKIDRKRVFATGWSNGGQLAYRLGLEHPEDFAGIAAVSASVPVKANLDCGETGKPVPAMVINGTADPINPFNGGMVRLGGAQLGNVMSSEDTARYWAKLLDVTAAPASADLPHKGGRTSVSSLTWMKDGKPVAVHYTVRNGGHALPLKGEDLDAPLAIWNFFSQLPGR
jgi:polyhydroxybutyrate depolymerase